MHGSTGQPSSIREVPEATTPRAEDAFIRGYRQLALETPARPRDVLLRALDVLLSALFLLSALPVALPITLIVLLTSGRPVLYRGERVGRGGRVFTMLKFRTLKADAETRLGPYLGEELVRRTQDEFTTIGKWLKATQLDDACAHRERFAVPRHPHAHGLRTERALPAHDAERVRRPLERVVGNADEQPPLGRGARAQHEPDADAGRSEREQQRGQSPPDASPLSDCVSTRQPVATTVRR